ncbi:replication-relaxation family protein [Cohnella fermenti]|uniref:Replication-relaxation n=1 Tax=Cohnella fermenti TaxID=2565925 RepID=A0A4S4BIC5_9BACL|nr:replication-relaxation family protein [Cohnella fermenti]THF74364.1 hypothetical protein E6C55_25310 [Cohnella fermenti]
MYYTAKKELLTVLYRYIMLTPEQVALILHYHIKTVYGAARHLKREGDLTSLPLPFRREHHVGYVLTAKGAKAAARICGEEDQYRVGEWTADPVQLEHGFGINAFFTDLIRHSLAQPGEGLSEWLGTREATDRYVQVKPSGRKARPVKPDGFGSYVFPGRGRLVFHLEYDTGTENLWRLKEKMVHYAELLPQLWPQVEAVHVLFVTKVSSRPKALIEIWEVLCRDMFGGDRLPCVWTIAENEWERAGMEQAAWQGAGGRKLPLRELPLFALPLSSQEGFLLIGKQQREPSPMKGR